MLRKSRFLGFLLLTQVCNQAEIHTLTSTTQLCALIVNNFKILKLHP